MLSAGKPGKEFIHFIKFLIGIEVPKTQTTPNEQAAIEKYSANINSAVEIGVFEGFNTLNIARSMSNSGKLHAIDPFLKGRLGICYGELISEKYIERAGLKSKVNFIKKYSFDADKDVLADVEFIFIDGDHSFEGIKKDWEIWSEKIKVNGVIALHDTSVPSHNPAVGQLGSVKYFDIVIKDDPRYVKLETVDSMNILKRVQ